MTPEIRALFERCRDAFEGANQRGCPQCGIVPPSPFSHGIRDLAHDLNMVLLAPTPARERLKAALDDAIAEAQQEASEAIDRATLKTGL